MRVRVPPDSSMTHHTIQSPTYRGWARQLVWAIMDRAGVEHQPADPGNWWWLVAWAQLEDTRATFNPLATTLDRSGATRFNDAGVKNYPSLTVGVNAAAATLISRPYVDGSPDAVDVRRGYDRIVVALREPAAMFGDFCDAVSQSAWSGAPRDGEHYRIRASESDAKAWGNRLLPM